MASTPSPGAGQPRRSPLDIAAAVLSLAGAAAIWLPFAWSTSPAKAADGRRPVVPGGAVPARDPIAAAFIRIIVKGSLPPGRAHWGAWALACCAMAITALFYAKGPG